MAKSPTAISERTFELIGSELAAAEAELARLTRRAQAFRTQGDSGPRGPEKLRAFLAAWRQQGVVDALQHERAALSVSRWEARTLPTDARIADLSLALDTAKLAYHAARAALFQARDARRDHEQTGVEFARNLRQAEAELRKTQAEILRREGELDDLERRQAAREALAA